MHRYRAQGFFSAVVLNNGVNMIVNMVRSGGKAELIVNNQQKLADSLESLGTAQINAAEALAKLKELRAELEKDLGSLSSREAALGAREQAAVEREQLCIERDEEMGVVTRQIPELVDAVGNVRKSSFMSNGKLMDAIG